MCRDRPVRSKIATTTQATRKPAVQTTKIQGMNRSKNLNSGRFAKPKALKLWVTAGKLTEFSFCDNGVRWPRVARAANIKMSHAGCG